MRRFILGFVAIFMILGLCSCNTKLLSIEQSRQNFIIYKDELQKIVYYYDLELSEIDDSNIDNQGENEFLEKTFIIVKDDAEIEIRLYNDSINATKGRESFAVSYVTHSSKSDSSFDVSLFVDLVNCVSGQEITEDFCKDFLDAPEEKYSAEARGFQKPSEDVIAKEHSLNFFEDWVISYYFYPESREELSFCGLTKHNM